MITIGFGTQLCGHLSEGALREWLVPDGRGGYAMGTVSGLRTRRYHALMVVSGDVPAQRRVGLASLDPVLTFPSGATTRLGTHEWPLGVVDPVGHTYLERFDLVDGLPRWRWRVGEVVLERTLAMAYGQPALAVVHRLVSGGPVTLTLDALCTWRDAHGERTADGPEPVVTPTADGAVIEGAYRLAGPGWTPAGGWWREVYYREEAARGLTAREDLWHAGSFTADLTPGATLELSAWAGDQRELAARPAPAGAVIDAARRRNRAVVTSGRPADEVEATLILAADAFIVTGGDAPDVVAGYPWFGSWSRDTFTSYEGLFLATGRAPEGRQLLLAQGASLSDGMVANTSDIGGATTYNSVDASLWFLDAVARHVDATGDTDLAVELLPAMRTVVEAYLAGTRYDIRVDPADGLVSQGVPGKALTWMDARVDGAAVTPRIGKPVEVNALWVNGLAGLIALCERIGSDPGAAKVAHDMARTSFGKRFVIPCGGGLLYDVVDGPDGHDPALRPNQLLAWSLPRAPLRPEASTLALIGEALLTPLGLRTLAPSSPDYRGRHRGDPRQRDHAYHQGTVWPWLIGPYISAQKRGGINNSGVFFGIEAHLSECGLGSVSEATDGQPPHAASGCPFQAWSVAELLRTRRLGRTTHVRKPE